MATDSGIQSLLDLLGVVSPAGSNSKLSRTAGTSAANSSSKTLSDVNQIISQLSNTFGTTNTSQNTANTTTTNNTKTTSEYVAPEAVTALMTQILEGTSGLAQTASGQKSAGIYDSTANTQLINDLVARTAAYGASLNKSSTVSDTGSINSIGSNISDVVQNTHTNNRGTTDQRSGSTVNENTSGSTTGTSLLDSNNIGQLSGGQAAGIVAGGTILNKVGTAGINRGIDTILGKLGSIGSSDTNGVGLGGSGGSLGQAGDYGLGLDVASADDLALAFADGGRVPSKNQKKSTDSSTEQAIIDAGGAADLATDGVLLSQVFGNTSVTSPDISSSVSYGSSGYKDWVSDIQTNLKDMKWSDLQKRIDDDKAAKDTYIKSMPEEMVTQKDSGFDVAAFNSTASTQRIKGIPFDVTYGKRNGKDAILFDDPNGGGGVGGRYGVIQDDGKGGISIKKEKVEQGGDWLDKAVIAGLSVMTGGAAGAALGALGSTVASTIGKKLITTGINKAVIGKNNVSGATQYSDNIDKPAQYADGGDIPGHDLTGKDDITIKVTGGEYVVPTDVVDHVGEDVFDELVALFHTPKNSAKSIQNKKR